MDSIIDFLGQAVPYVVAGLLAAMVGTFFGNKSKK